MILLINKVILSNIDCRVFLWRIIYLNTIRKWHYNMTKEIQDRQINWYMRDKWPKLWNWNWFDSSFLHVYFYRKRMKCKCCFKRQYMLWFEYNLNVSHIFIRSRYAGDLLWQVRLSDTTWTCLEHSPLILKCNQNTLIFDNTVSCC